MHGKYGLPSLAEIEACCLPVDAAAVPLGFVPVLARPVSAQGDDGQERAGENPVEAARQGIPWDCRDWGNAQRLTYRFGDKIKFDVRCGSWRVWDGLRWVLDPGDSFVMQRAAESARLIFDEASVASNPDTAKMLGSWAGKSLDLSRLMAAVTLAAKQPGMTPAAGEWDADPMLLCCANGVIDLTSGKLLPPDPARLITKSSPVIYDPAAHSELWDRALGDWQESTEVIDLLQRIAGYCATGSGSEEKLFFVHGPTASGKTTFAESVKSALGDYGATADFESFLKRGQGSGGGAARGDIARLAGARFVTSSEVEDGRQLAEGLVKNISGGEKIVARHLYKGEFEFLPTFKLMLIANDAPHIDADDAAMWRRVIRIPFERTIPKELRDSNLKASLVDPKIGGPAVLAWIIAGAREWQRVGLKVPACIDAATDALRAEMDVFSEFADDRLEFNEFLSCRASELRRVYDDWATAQGIRFKIGPKKLSAKLKARGAVSERGAAGIRRWSGVALRLGVL